MKRLVAALFSALACLGASAQDKQVTIDANHLTRGEVRYGGLSSEEATESNTARFILERTLLGLSFQKPGLSTRITAQHSGTWGGSDGGYFNVYEAWAQLTSKKGFFTKVGRQNLSYDDQRIFGADDWAMTARSHDVLKLGYESKVQKLHLIGGFNQTTANMNGGSYYSGGVQPYKSLGALWYHIDIPQTHIGASLLFLDAGIQGGEKGAASEKTYYEQMLGSFLSYRPKGWNIEAAYYRQMGKEEHGLPVKAWMASFKAVTTSVEKWTFSAGYDYLSGDKYFAIPPNGQIGMVRHDKIRGFSSLYGSHHKFYGAMDFFYVTTYVNGFTPGLQNAYIGAKWSPMNKVSLDASYHFLAVTADLNSIDKPLGHEVEFSASYSFNEDVRLSAGYSHMQGTKTMVALKKTSDNRRLDWAWVMLTVSPKLFSGKW